MKHKQQILLGKDESVKVKTKCFSPVRWLCARLLVKTEKDSKQTL